MSDFCDGRIKENKFYFVNIKNHKATWFIKSIDGPYVDIYNITDNVNMKKTHFEFSFIIHNLQDLD